MRACLAAPTTAREASYGVTGSSPTKVRAGVDCRFQKPIDPAALIRDVSGDLQGG
jgi:hypothetical protein